MKRWRVRGGRALRGAVRVPGDKSIGHRALLFGALAEGRARISGLSGGLDNLATAQALRDMGARVVFEPPGSDVPDGGVTATVEGVGLHGLRLPPGALDCGNSGTTMRLLAGLLVGQRFGTRLVGDASLSRRPMKRVIEPLRARGGHIAGSVRLDSQELYPPLAVAPLVEGERLRPLEYDMPVASAQVKSAILISGLYASGVTAIREPVLTRDHTERMLDALGVPIERAGSMVVLDPVGWRGGWDGFAWHVPGDASAAAFFVCAGLLVPGSELRVEAVNTNPTRTGLLDALRPMNAGVIVEPRTDDLGGEPVADLVVEHTRALFSGRIGGELVTRMIDEVPVFAALCARARGRSEVRDAEELRVKESDRVRRTVEFLGAFGVSAQELDDGFTLEGAGAALRGARVRSHGDHRIAMSAAVLALAVEAETVIDDVACVDTSFPAFVDRLRALGADIDVEEVPDDEAASGVGGASPPAAGGWRR